MRPPARVTGPAARRPAREVPGRAPRRVYDRDVTASPAAEPASVGTGPVAASAVDRDAAGAPVLRWSPDPLLGAPYEQAPLGPATLVRGPAPARDGGAREPRGRVPELPPGADVAAQDAALEQHGAVLVPLTPPGTTPPA